MGYLDPLREIMITEYFSLEWFDSVIIMKITTAGETSIRGG